MAQTRVYETSGRLRDLLASGMDKFPAQVEGWTKEVEDNRISDELRQVFVALGWISSRDSRVTLIRDFPSGAAAKGK